MARRPRQQRGRKGPFFALTLVAVAAIVVVFTVGYVGAVAAGLVEAPNLAAWFGSDKLTAPKIEQPPGTVTTFFSPREIPAYTRITRDMLLNDQGVPEMKFYKPEEIPDHWITEGNDIIGRVLAIDKLPGRVFTQRDFFPEGTMEGIAAGIPPGRRAMVVSTDQIRGLGELNRFDRFDVLKSEETTSAVVTNGIVVQPARRMYSAEEQSRLELARNRSRSVADPNKEWFDVTIAVEPHDVDRLSRALAATDTNRRPGSRGSSSTHLYAVIHSGRPDVSREGLVATYYSPREIPAYTRITQEMLMDATGNSQAKYVRPEEVGDDWITSSEDLVGRVLAIDKPRNRVFTQQDFFPLGTAPGIAAGVPAGQRAVVVSPEQIRGIGKLNRFDRFDVFRSESFSQIVVSGGMVVQPARRMMTEKEKVRADEGTRRGSESDLLDVTLAVSPDDVDRLSRSLASSSPLYAILHSGHPDEQHNAQYRMRAFADLTTFEEIVGSRRRRVIAQPPRTASDLALGTGSTDLRIPPTLWYQTQ